MAQGSSIEPEIPMSEAQFLQLLEHTREGRFVAKKGVNIETSPDSVKFARGRGQ
jgi:hypothetical protein